MPGKNKHGKTGQQTVGEMVLKLFDKSFHHTAKYWMKKTAKSGPDE